MKSSDANRKKIKFTNKKLGETIFYWSLLAIPLIQFCIFYIGVNFNSVLLAVKRYDYITGEFTFFGINNFKTFFNQVFAGNGSMWHCFKNSLIVYLISVFITTPISILFSYYIYKNGKQKNRPWTPANVIAETAKVLLFLPTIVPSIALVIMFKYFGENSLPELLNKWWGTSFSGLLSNDKTALTYILGFCILTGFGINMILYTGAMSTIDKSQIESAQIDGVTPFRELRRIVFPAIYPTFVMQMVLSIAGFFTSQAFLYSFYGSEAPERIRTFGYYLFITVIDSATMSEYPYAAAIGLVFTVLATPVTLLMKFSLEYFGPSPTRDGKLRKVKENV